VILLRTNVITTLTSVISIRQEWFLHAECDFDTYECYYDTHECDYDKHECDYAIHEYDLYTQKLNFNSGNSVTLGLFSMFPCWWSNFLLFFCAEPTKSSTSVLWCATDIHFDHLFKFVSALKNFKVWSKMTLQSPLGFPISISLTIYRFYTLETKTRKKKIIW
jgi:hypothetical protein